MSGDCNFSSKLDNGSQPDDMNRTNGATVYPKGDGHADDDQTIGDAGVAPETQ